MPGRPAIPREHIEFIRRISSNHPEYGEDRIALELEVKFGIRHADRTVGHSRSRRTAHPDALQGLGADSKLSTALAYAFGAETDDAGDRGYDLFSRGTRREQRPGETEHDLEGRGGGHSGAAHAPEAPGRQPRPPAWIKHFEALRQQSPQQEPSPEWPEGKEILYILRHEAGYHGAGLAVEIEARGRKKNGSWGAPRACSVGYRLLHLLPDPLDRQILQSLVGTPRYSGDVEPGNRFFPSAGRPCRVAAADVPDRPLFFPFFRTLDRVHRRTRPPCSAKTPSRVENAGKKVSCRSAFDEWLWQEMGIRGIAIPYGAPNAAAHVERLIGTLRRECLDRMLIWNERHLRCVLAEFVAWYNHGRVHQGLNGIPDPDPVLAAPKPASGKLVATPVLNGLHHDYRLAA